MVKRVDQERLTGEAATTKPGNMVLPGFRLLQRAQCQWRSLPLVKELVDLHPVDADVLIRDAEPEHPGSLSVGTASVRPLQERPGESLPVAVVVGLRRPEQALRDLGVHQLEPPDRSVAPRLLTRAGYCAVARYAEPQREAEIGPVLAGIVTHIPQQCRLAPDVGEFLGADPALLLHDVLLLREHVSDLGRRPCRRLRPKGRGADSDGGEKADGQVAHDCPLGSSSARATCPGCKTETCRLPGRLLGRGRESLLIPVCTAHRQLADGSAVLR